MRNTKNSKKNDRKENVEEKKPAVILKEYKVTKQTTLLEFLRIHCLSLACSLLASLKPISSDKPVQDKMAISACILEM